MTLALPLAVAAVLASGLPLAVALAVGVAASPPVLVGAGGVLGALARHLVGEAVESRVGGTFLVNVFGSFALGVVLSAPVGDAAVLALGTGFCGAFTTFSTFAFETVRLFETGERRRALANAGGTLAAALLAALAGGAAGAALA